MINAMTTDLGSYQVLESPQTAERKRRILGSVIPSDCFTTPFDTYAPYFDDPRWDSDKEGKKQLESTIDFFWKPSTAKGENSVKLKNVINTQADKKQDDGHFQLTQVMQAFFNKDKKRSFKFDAVEAEEYTIDNPGRAVAQRLSPCEPWMTDLQELYKKDKRKDPSYYIVTGVYTCKNTTVSWDQDDSVKKGAKGKVDGGAGAIVPPSAAKVLDSEIDYQGTRGKTERASRQFSDEIIIALRYHVLHLNTEPDQPDQPEQDQKQNQKQNQKQTGWLSKLTPRSWVRRKSSTGTIELERPKIKSLSMGKPVRAKGMINSYGDDSGGMFYWEEPIYALPDHRPEQDRLDANSVLDGAAR